VNPNLTPPRWPNGPQICAASNLPSFPTEKAAKDSIDHFHLVMLSALWECRCCDGWHAWTVRATDSSGNAYSGTVTEAGAPLVCKRIQDLISRTRK
jgi:hypothetical protein